MSVDDMTSYQSTISASRVLTFFTFLSWHFFTSRQHSPVGATEDIINSIPKHALTDAELGRLSHLIHLSYKSKSWLLTCIAPFNFCRGQVGLQCLQG